MIQETFTVV